MLPSFVNAGDGVYMIHTNAITQEIKDSINRQTIEFCDGFTLGGECENIRNNSFCTEYYAITLSDNTLQTPGELDLFMHRNRLLAGASITIETVADYETVSEFFPNEKPVIAWIYGLCKNPDVTTKGFTRVLIRKIQQQLYQTELWIGVMDKPGISFEKLVRLYLSYGFVKPHYDKISIYQQGVKVSDFWACNMIYREDLEYTADRQKYALKFMLAMRRILNTTKRMKTVRNNAFFPPANYRTLSGLLDLPHEYGGSMEPSVKRTYETGETVELIIKRMATGGQYCMVDYMSEIDTDNADAHFHTHPYACYVQETMLVGVPSIMDLAMAVEIIRHGTFIHQVIAHEGIYTYHLTDSFKAYMVCAEELSQVSWEEIVAGLRQSIKEVLTPIEHLRTKEAITGTPWSNEDIEILNAGGTISTVEQISTVIHKLLIVFNNMKFSDLAKTGFNIRYTANGRDVAFPIDYLVNSAALTDFKLFDVKFTPLAVAELVGITLTDVTIVETVAEPNVETVAEPVLETVAEPVLETNEEPNVETVVEPDVEMG